MSRHLSRVVLGKPRAGRSYIIIHTSARRRLSHLDLKCRAVDCIIVRRLGKREQFLFEVLTLVHAGLFADDNQDAICDLPGSPVNAD